MMNHPDEIKWVEGELPPVASVDKDCVMLVWMGYDITEDEWERVNVRCNPCSYNSPEHNGEFLRITTCVVHKGKWCEINTRPIDIGLEKVMFHAEI